MPEFFRKNLLFLITPALIIGIIIPFNVKKDMVIFPGKNSMYLTAYSDEKGRDDTDTSFLLQTSDSTRTTISKYVSDSNYIDIEYKIGSKNVHPFAGFQWILRSGQPYIDISDYDHLTVTLHPNTSEDVIILILQFFVDGFSKPADRMTWQYLSKELLVKDKKYTYTIPLSEFKTPLWLYNQFKITEKDLGRPDLSFLGMISIQDGSGAIGEIKRIVLNDIRFKKSGGLSTVLKLLSILMIYYLVFFSVILFRKFFKSKPEQPVTIPYQVLPIEEENNDDAPRVFEYLGSHFSDQTLSLSRISTDLNISGNKISSIVKEKYHMSFRQYLNTIRIAEAKRLLQETKMQVSQIAYKVGYTNLTHFSRTFKEITSVSPNTFRMDRSEFREESLTRESNLETDDPEY